MREGTNQSTWMIPAFVVAGLMMFVVLCAGAGQASASHSVFCQENVTICPGGSQYPENVGVAASMTPGQVAGTFAEVEIPGLTTLSCTAAKVVGSYSVHKEGPMTGKGFFSSSVCSPEGCSFHSVGEHSWEWEATGGGDGTTVMSKPVLRVVCTKTPKFTCDYSASSITAQFEGGPWQEAFITGEEGALEMVAGGFLCNLYATADLRFRGFVVSPASTTSIYLTN